MSPLEMFALTDALAFIASSFVAGAMAASAVLRRQHAKELLAARDIGRIEGRSHNKASTK